MNTSPTKQVLDIKRPPKKKKVAPKKLPKQPTKKISTGFHKHPFVVPVVTFLVLFFISMIGYVTLNGQTIGASDSHVVRLSIDGDTKTLPTRAKNVKEFLSRANIEIHEGDDVEPELNTDITDDDFRVNVYKARPVTIIDGDKQVRTLSAAKTPRSVAAQAGIKVYAEDSVESSSPSQQILKDGVIGERVIVDRATPTYLNLYGTQVNIRTRAKTVGDLLKDKKVNLRPGDTVSPAQETVITPNTQIFVTRQGTQIISAEEEIPAPVQTIEDASLSFGAMAIRQQGSPGKKVVTYQIETQNGREVGRKVIQEIVATEPTTQIVARGKAYTIPDDKSGLLAAAGIPQSDYPYLNYIISHESGWCATKAQGQYGNCPAYVGSVPSYGGYGLCQSTPPQKMATAGADWMTNPVTQLRWCTGYASRYGGWSGAYQFWISHGWW